MESHISRIINTYIKENQFDEIQSVLEPYLLEERRRIISEKVKKTSLLYAAVECQNVRIINFLLYECGADPNDTGYEMGKECPCLWKAADLRNMEIVKILMECGADINRSNLLGTTALFIACRKGNFNMVRYLIENGADIHCCNHDGVTCLMASLISPDICKFLISLGAYVNKVDALGNSALMKAIRLREIRTIMVLLRSSADITITNNFGENAIFLADGEQLLIHPRYFPPGDQLVMTSRALRSEISSCQNAILGEESSATRNWQRALRLRNLPRNTPLHLSTITNAAQSELVQFRNFFNSGTERILFFLESRVGLRNRYTIDLLASAICKTESLDQYAILFKRFVNVINTTDNRLFFEMNVQIQILILNFIGKNRFEDNFETAFSGFSVLLDGIVDHLKNLSQRIKSMNDAGRLSKIDIVELYMYLILTVIDKHCQQRMKPLLEKLYEILDLNLRGRRHISLLHFCIDKGYQPNVAQILLSAGADINTMDDLGLTPAHYAIRSRIYCTRESFDLFFNHGLHFNESSEENLCFTCVLNNNDLIRQPLRYSSLQCLAAKVVAKNYDTTKKKLPRTIQIIIHSHKL